MIIKIQTLERNHMKKTILTLWLLSTMFLNANNLQIGKATLVDKNTSEGCINIQFDISWENSWRTSSEPNNWDGVWLFVKYKNVSDGNWYHATLSNTNSNHFTGSQGSAATISIAPGGTGAVYYRSQDGKGTFSSSSDR